MGTTTITLNPCCCVKRDLHLDANAYPDPGQVGCDSDVCDGFDASVTLSYQGLCEPPPEISNCYSHENPYHTGGNWKLFCCMETGKLYLLHWVQTDPPGGAWVVRECEVVDCNSFYARGSIFAGFVGDNPRCYCTADFEITEP
jgi:hypothetical protein